MINKSSCPWGAFAVYQNHLDQVLVLTFVIAVTISADPAGITMLVSVDSDGNLANHWSYGPAVSADGRYVAFTSAASNLVVGDTNGDLDQNHRV